MSDYLSHEAVLGEIERDLNRIADRLGPHLRRMGAGWRLYQFEVNWRRACSMWATLDDRARLMRKHHTLQVALDGPWEFRPNNHFQAHPRTWELRARLTRVYQLPPPPPRLLF